MDTLNHTLCAWEDILARLGCVSVSWRGVPLSDRDRRTYTEAIVLCALHLTDLRQRYDGIGTDREIVAWAFNTASLDVSDLGSFLSDAITELRHVASPMSYKGFKRSLSGMYPFAGAFLAPVRAELEDFLRNPNPRGFYVCYQFLSFLTHLSLIDIVLDLEKEYEDLESSLLEAPFPEDIVAEMHDIMSEWMKDFSLTEENFVPKHGPGGTFETNRKDGTLVKYSHLKYDDLLTYAFRKFAGIDVTSYSPWKDSFMRPSGTLEKLERSCEIVYVPKSMKTRRIISKEPATLQYVQQGVLTALDDYLQGHPYLRDHISLHKQEVSAELAIRSSGTGTMATIDLSSASDRVTLRLVKAVFGGTPLYPFLIATRSRTAVLPSGKRVVLAKFAPMGSALCFPVETLIFACAVEFAVRRARRTHLGSFPEWRVYGDDIIVHSDLFEDALLVLEGLGFIINRSKSFTQPARFRESCGGEGYDGVDVTPMRISRKFLSVRGSVASRHAATYMGLIDLANQCYDRQFSLMRAWVVRVLLSYPDGPPLFSSDGRGALYSPWPDNYRADTRYNRVSNPSRSNPGGNRYQRLECRIISGRSVGVEHSCRDLMLEQARYYETLRMTSCRSGDMFSPDHRVSIPGSTGDLRLRKVWVEKPTLT